MPNLGPAELIIIALVILLLFGWKRLPDAARSLGRSARVFKSEVNEMKQEDEARARLDASRQAPVTPTPARPDYDELGRPIAQPIERPTERFVDPTADPVIDRNPANGNAILRDNSPRTDNQSGSY